MTSQFLAWFWSWFGYHIPTDVIIRQFARAQASLTANAAGNAAKAVALKLLADDYAAEADRAARIADRLRGLTE